MNKRWSDGLLFFFYRVVYRVFFFYIHENGTQREEEQEGKEEREGNEWRRRRGRWMMSENGGALLAIASASRRQSSSFFFVFISATLAPVPSALTVVENLGFTGFYRVLLVFFSGFYREKERCVWFCRKKNEKLRKTARDWLPARGPGRDWIVRRWRHDGWAIDDVTEPLLPFFLGFFRCFSWLLHLLRWNKKSLDPCVFDWSLMASLYPTANGKRKVPLIACLIGRWWRHWIRPPIETTLLLQNIFLNQKLKTKDGVIAASAPFAGWPIYGRRKLMRKERKKRKQERKKTHTPLTFRMFFASIFVTFLSTWRRWGNWKNVETNSRNDERRHFLKSFFGFFSVFFPSRVSVMDGRRRRRSESFPSQSETCTRVESKYFHRKKKIRRDPRKNEKKKYISRFRSRWWDLGEVHRRVR